MLILVCEDEPQCRERIQGMIDRWISTCGYRGIKTLMFSSSEDLLNECNKGLKADILFLDILFQNEMDGMQAAKQIRQLDESLAIVFVTNAEAYAMEGYAVRAFRYLRKPVRYEDIVLCLDVAYTQHTLGRKGYLTVQDGRERMSILYEEILFLEAQWPHTLIFQYTMKEPARLHARISDLANQLPEDLFVPCHRSYIVNIMHVRGIRKNELILSAGQSLPVSRACVNQVNEAFDSYYQKGVTFIDVDRV